MEKSKGELGFWRRFTGTWAGLATMAAMFLSGFGFYTLDDYRVLVVGGVLCAILLIAGLAKDVTEIIKTKLK